MAKCEDAAADLGITKAKTPAATKLPPALFETVAGWSEPRLL
jgi:hypothetical protein